VAIERVVLTSLLDDWRYHDLRRSFGTYTAERDVAPHVVAALVNHISGHKGGVADVYNRAVYAPEKRAVREMWGRETVAQLIKWRRR
jgi:integrase